MHAKLAFLRLTPMPFQLLIHFVAVVCCLLDNNKPKSRQWKDGTAINNKTYAVSLKFEEVDYVLATQSH